MRARPFQEVADGARGGAQVALEQEMPGVEQADLGARGVVGEGEGAGRPEDLVVAAPDSQQRHPAGAQVGAQLRVQREVAGVVGEQPELHEVVARPGHLREVVVPGVGADQALVGHAVQVPPPDGLQGQGLADGGLGLRAAFLPVVAQRLPEGRHEAGLVAVAVLGDDRRDRCRVAQGEPPAHRRTVVMHVHGVPGDAERAQQARGQPGQGVEGVAELPGGRRVRQAEPQVVGGDHAVLVSQQRDEVAEHERAGRESVQQHEGGRICRARCPVEQAAAVDVGVPEMNGWHV
jgi:hypothetical protein